MEMGIELVQDLETWQLIAGGVVIVGGIIMVALAIHNVTVALRGNLHELNQSRGRSS